MPFFENLQKITHDQILFKLWAKDKTIFSSSDSLMMDWLFEPEVSLSNLEKNQKKVDKILSHGFSHIVLLGMGGSSLAPYVFSQIFSKTIKFKNFFVLDTIHPDDVIKLQKKIDISKTLFIVSSKSGSTLEPNLLYKHFYAQLCKHNVKDPYKHFIAITDPITSLEQEAVENGFLETFFGNPMIGGRFSSSSVFGIIPMLLMGIDAKKILEKNTHAMKDFGPSVLPQENPAALLGLFLALNQSYGKDKLRIYLSDSLKSLGLWLEQLLAESLGKKGLGIVPILADTFESKPDVMHCYIHLKGEHFHDDENHDEAKIYLELDSIEDILAHMFLWEIATSICGVVSKINPFDQPDVELSKNLAKKLLSEEIKETLVDEEETKNFVEKIEKNSYLAILGFLEESPENISFLYELKNIFKAKGPEILVQFGPRYLHSTGQLFKGKNGGNFLIITSDYKNLDLQEFIKAHKSQAYGDYNALLSKNKNALLVNSKNIGDTHDVMNYFKKLL